jgi:hypothetical protein
MTAKTSLIAKDFWLHCPLFQHLTGHLVAERMELFLFQGFERKYA